MPFLDWVDIPTINATARARRYAVILCTLRACALVYNINIHYLYTALRVSNIKSSKAAPMTCDRVCGIIKFFVLCVYITYRGI